MDRCLCEQNSLQELEDLCKVNRDAVLLLEKGDAQTEILSCILSHLGQLYGRAGLAPPSIACLEESLAVRLQLKAQAWDHDMEVSWSQHNIGEAYELLGDRPKAYDWFVRCQDQWKQWAHKTITPGPDSHPIMDYSSPFQRKSMATCLFFMGQVQESKRQAEQLLRMDPEMAKDHWIVMA